MRHLTAGLSGEVLVTSLGRPGEPLPPAGRASQAELRAWLLRMLLRVLLPTWRTAIGNEEYVPLSLHAWFRAAERLLALGFPRHWVARAVADALARTARAGPGPAVPDGSPLPVAYSAARSAGGPPLDLSPFRMDLVAAVALGAPAAGLVCAAAVRAFTLRVQMPGGRRGAGSAALNFGCGRGTAAALGLLLSAEPRQDCFCPAPGCAPLRDLLRGAGRGWVGGAGALGGQVQLVSCLELLPGRRRVRVRLEAAVVARLAAAGWVAAVIRTDSWLQVSGRRQGPAVHLYIFFMNTHIYAWIPCEPHTHPKSSFGQQRLV